MPELVPTLPRWLNKCLTRRQTINGRELLVFDNLVTVGVIRRTYQALRRSEYVWNARDSELFGHSIRWKATIEREPPWRVLMDRVATVVGHLTTDRAGVRLFHAYANFNLYGEVHYGHIDGRNVITALYCANVEWNSLWQGETIFFDGDEAVHLVAPKPGRLIVFDGGIVHRGTPPSRDCWEPRLNVVFKFAMPTEAKFRIQRRRRRLPRVQKEVVKLNGASSSERPERGNS